MNAFRVLEENQKPLGFYMVKDQDLIFFGTKHTTLDDLQRLFPFLNFSELKQVHEAQIEHVTHPSSSPLLVADGQWTAQENLGLLIKTADCIPLLVRSKKAVAALHAGWRGVAGGIGPKLFTLNSFQDEDVSCFIGPHIQRKNFEVGLDVAQTLFGTDPKRDSSTLLPHPDPQKKYVDLAQILTHQLDREVLNVDLDTFSDPERFWSYRRDQGKTGRLYSFIARIRYEDFTKLKL